MSRAHSDIAFMPAVRALQARMGSRSAYAALALELEDKFSRLKEAHQAQACINSLLPPHQQAPEQPDEFCITPEDRGALRGVTKGGFGGRGGAVEAAMGVLGWGWGEGWRQI